MIVGALLVAFELFVLRARSSSHFQTPVSRQVEAIRARRYSRSSFNESCYTVPRGLTGLCTGAGIYWQLSIACRFFRG
jgi:hypothetical protein